MWFATENPYSISDQNTEENSGNKRWAYICSEGFFAGRIFEGAYFRRGFLSEGILRFKMGLACQ